MERQNNIKLTSKDILNNNEVLLEDIDRGIVDFFTNKIKINVTENNSSFKVPVILATPERWVQLKRDKVMRDNNKTIILPIIVLKRDTIEHEDTWWPSSNTINMRANIGSYKEDRSGISQLNTVNLQAKLPKYIKITYSVTIQSRYMTTTNSIIEQIILNGFWGFFEIKENHIIKWEIVSIADTSNVEDFTDDIKLITNNFQIIVTSACNLNYINDIPTIKKKNTPNKIIFTENLN